MFFTLPSNGNSPSPPPQVNSCDTCAMKYINEPACPFRKWHGLNLCKHGNALRGAAMEIAENVGVTGPVAKRPEYQLNSIRDKAVFHFESCLVCQHANYKKPK